MEFVGDYTDTDTIGLVVTMVAVLAVLIVGKVQQRKTEPMQFSPKIILGAMRESGGDRMLANPTGSAQVVAESGGPNSMQQARAA
jgi:hypothetical protein